jgi:preprotein translocase subunit SecF
MSQDEIPASVTVRKVVQQGPRQQPKRGTRQKRKGK